MKLGSEALIAKFPTWFLLHPTLLSHVSEHFFSALDDVELDDQVVQLSHVLGCEPSVAAVGFALQDAFVDARSWRRQRKLTLVSNTVESHPGIASGSYSQPCCEQIMRIFSHRKRIISDCFRVEVITDEDDETVVEWRVVNAF